MAMKIALLLLASATPTADARILAGHLYPRRNLHKLAASTEDTGGMFSLTLLQLVVTSY